MIDGCIITTTRSRRDVCGFAYDGIPPSIDTALHIGVSIAELSMACQTAFPSILEIAALMVKEATQRRVYVLPTDLVERILSFQRDKGLPSEVEAVRRLLDEALLQRDSANNVIERLQSKFRTTKILPDLAKEILVGHPLITEIQFGANHIDFAMKGHGRFQMRENGKIYEEFSDNEWREWIDDIPF
jgi:hypothetical protein